MTEKKQIFYLKILTYLMLSMSFNQVLAESTTTCMPETELSFPVGDKSLAMTEATFNQVIKKFQSRFESFIFQKLGKQLIIKSNWESPKVNAHATRDFEDNPIIVIHGGMARHPELTTDGLSLILCHELGHHLGGAPKRLRGNTSKRSWSSAEGQADYYAAAKCLPLLFEEDENLSKDLDLMVPEHELKQAYKRCDREDNLCARVAVAGLSVSKVFASLKSGNPEPSLIAVDRSEVKATFFGHSNPQCRLDTFMSGITCNSDPRIDFDLADPNIGACHRPYTEVGVRPRCWYSPES